MGLAFYETKAGQRLIESVREKMDVEKLTVQDFEFEKKNRWKIQGKSFYDIFCRSGECRSIYDETLRKLLDWIERVNTALFRQFDEMYDGQFSIEGGYLSAFDWVVARRSMPADGFVQVVFTPSMSLFCKS